MATAIYKINRRFDYCDAATLKSYLQRKGVHARVESGYPADEIRITSDASANVINEAVDAATMRYCPECIRRLQSLADHVI
jgi:hypothetical protein